MNEALIEAWNKKVSPKDIVYHLGDITFIKDIGIASTMIERLNGTIHYIVGNHDNVRIIETCPNIVSISYGYKGIKVQGQYIELCHFPIEEWNKMHHGAWHLHGHVHNSDRNGYHTITKIPNRMDVGVDNFADYAPISFEEIKERFTNV